jgi:hypothetical protein
MGFALNIRNPKFTNPWQNSESYFVKWFEKSWDALEWTGVSQEIYEKTYGVKLLFLNNSATISGVEFPSQAEATLFVLRWS